MSHWSPAGRAVSSFPRALPSRLSISRLVVDVGDATRLRSISVAFELRRKIDARQRVISKIESEEEGKERKGEKKRGDQIRSKRETAKVIARQPPFSDSTPRPLPFWPSFFDDVRVVVSPISYRTSIVNQNAALPRAKVPNKIHKFPLYCTRGGFRQKFPKFRK